MAKTIKKIVPITELRRSFGEVTNSLPFIDELILTKGGKPFAVLKATKEEKMKLLKKSFGALKGTDLDSDRVWRKVLKKKSRVAPTNL